MKKYSKFCALVLVVLLLSAMAPAASASSVKVAPGGSTTVSFSVNGCGLDGSFSFSDSSFITSVSYSDNGAMDGSVSNNSAFYYGSSESTVVIYVTVSVSPNATDGQTAQITFTYETSDENGNMSEWKSSARTIEVDIPNADSNAGGTLSSAEATEAPAETKPAAEPTESPAETKPATEPTERPTETKPATEPTTAPTEPKPTTKPTTAPTETKPAAKPTTPPAAPEAPTPPSGTGTTAVPNAPVASKVDYSELTRQIELAEGLSVEDYTTESWTVLIGELEKAKNALSSKDQRWVDTCAENLEKAMDTLVDMDYSQLQSCIAAAQQLLASNQLSNQWQVLHDALEQGYKQMGSGNQAAVDEICTQLRDIIDQINVTLEEQNSAVKEVVKEVIVEVEPQDDYCNVGSHHVWPIAFFASLALNVVAIALLAWYLVRRKKNQTDDTPLVDYDIDDDMY